MDCHNCGKDLVSLGSELLCERCIETCVTVNAMREIVGERIHRHVEVALEESLKLFEIIEATPDTDAPVPVADLKALILMAAKNNRVALREWPHGNVAERLKDKDWMKKEFKMEEG